MRTFLSLLSLLLIPVRCAWGHMSGNASAPRILAVLAAASCIAVSPTSLAQDEDEDDEEDQPTVVEADDDEVEEVVVTGSRLKRDTYTTVSPLQIITAEVSREAGLIDATDIVQKATVSAGSQVDVTFSGFVLEDGPGTQTANLRGLGSSRTLSLINGRRIGPAGVEGAPASPDLSLIPGSLVQQYDLLLDGASSIYGSDAVAGVLNVILRKDFDGLEVEMFPRRPSHDGGDQDVLSLTWGKNFDRGFVGVGVETSSSDAVTRGQRPWTAGCSRNVEVDEGGRIRHTDLYWSGTYGMDYGDCLTDSEAGWVSLPFPIYSLYYTPSHSDGGWENYSRSYYIYSHPSFGTYRWGTDGDGDGETDVNWADYTFNGKQDHVHLFPETSSIKVMTYGEYTLEGEMNLTPFFEISYVEHDYYQLGTNPQLFREVPANNPYNICNPNGNGVDCGLGFQGLLTNPNFVAQWVERLGWVCTQFGIPLSACTPGLFGHVGNAMGPVPVTPVVSVEGDRNQVTRYLEQFRYVAGFTGDIPALNVWQLSDWSFEFSMTHSRSDGNVQRPGVRGDRLDLALGRYSTNGTPCENNTETPMAFDTAPGCVPVNLFARSLMGSVVGEFATQAERDYLFSSRDFKTEYRQTVASYYMTGGLFELPAGGVSAGVGVEFREDQITSTPNHVAARGLLRGFFADEGAEGQRYTQEFFSEIELPILAGIPGATELTTNLSARWTQDQFYGSAWTGAAKIAWRPIDSLMVRATAGTSYRAPNLRELFLKGQTGFRTLSDPCLAPRGAVDPVTGGYLPDEDLREPHVLRNCRDNGIDPTTVFAGGLTSYSVEVKSEGGLADGLLEETSESITGGMVWEQPFTNAFDLTVGVNYYQIKIDNTIIEPHSQFIINDCYLTESGNSVFCHRIDRGEESYPRISLVSEGFINRDNETVRGVDFNLAFDTTFTFLDRPFDLGLDINAHRTIERSELYTTNAGVPYFDTDQREWYFAERRGSANVRFDYDQWRLSWTARYVSAVDEDPALIDNLGDANRTTGLRSETCLGPPEDLSCRDVGFASSYIVHSASVRYAGDTWLVRAGAANIFDTEPPVVQEGPALISNTPLGAGYDLSGRTWFLNLSMRFFGGE